MEVAGMFNNKFRVILIAALLSGATGPGDVATTISDVKDR